MRADRRAASREGARRARVRGDARELAVYQRRGGQWIGHIPLKLEQKFASSFLGADIEVAGFYRNTDLDLPSDQPSSDQS